MTTLNRLFSQRTLVFYILAITSAISLLVWMTACQSKAEGEPVSGDDPVAVQMAPVSRVTDSQPIWVSGVISGKEEAKLSFKTGGIIRDIPVSEGQTVKKGQLLATLDLTEIGALAVQADEMVQKAERDLQRAEKLYRDSVITREQIENARTGYTVALKNRDIAGFNREYSEIRAPFSGKVLVKLMTKGELAGPGAPVLILSSSDAGNWILKTGITDQDWVRISVGLKAQVIPDATKDTLQARVTSVSDGVSPVSGLISAELTLDQTKSKLASGLFASAKILTGTSSFLAVPIEALVEGNQNDAFVYTVSDGKAVRIPVQVAYLTGNQAVIRKGLEGVSEVVTRGSAFLTGGSPVQVNN